MWRSSRFCSSLSTRSWRSPTWRFSWNVTICDDSGWKLDQSWGSGRPSKIFETRAAEIREKAHLEARHPVESCQNKIQKNSDFLKRLVQLSTSRMWYFKTCFWLKILTVLFLTKINYRSTSALLLWKLHYPERNAGWFYAKLSKSNFSTFRTNLWWGFTPKRQNLL